MKILGYYVPEQNFMQRIWEFSKTEKEFLMLGF